MNSSAQFSKTKPQEPKSYFLYARKSQEGEERQQLSIPAQVEELTQFARKENIRLADILTEAKSAKELGRPVFNKMLSRIEAGEAEGILAWHPDRLARNAVDAGKIIHFLDTEELLSLKFPSFWFRNTPQGLFVLNMAFGQSKYFSDNLSVNVKRGLRQKVRRGEFPGVAPLGYLNDVRNKTVVVDKEKAPIIKKAFELYARGVYTLEDISHFLAKNGIGSQSGRRYGEYHKGGNPIHKDNIKFVLQNPFYTGLFRYTGEIHEGTHEPIASKKLFDRVQQVMGRRGRSKHTRHNHPFAGFIECGECGYTVTCTERIKHYPQTKRTVTYVYYHCTKKSKIQKCFQACTRQKDLLLQINKLIQKVSLSQSEGDYFLQRIGEEEKGILATNETASKELSAKVSSIDEKLSFLLDSFVDRVIERPEYLEKKSELVSQKKTLEEKLLNLSKRPNDWLKPFREWVGVGMEAAKIAEEDGNLRAKKEILQKIGSNLKLQNGRLWWEISSSSQNPYLLLLRGGRGGVGREKGRAAPLCRPTSRILVSLYDEARNHFIKNA